MHSNGTLPLDAPLAARCVYTLKAQEKIFETPGKHREFHIGMWPGCRALKEKSKTGFRLIENYEILDLNIFIEKLLTKTRKKCKQLCNSLL